MLKQSMSTWQFHQPDSFDVEFPEFIYAEFKRNTAWAFFSYYSQRSILTQSDFRSKHEATYTLEAVSKNMLSKPGQKVPLIINPANSDGYYLGATSRCKENDLALDYEGFVSMLRDIGVYEEWFADRL